MSLKRLAYTILLIYLCDIALNASIVADSKLRLETLQTQLLLTAECGSTKSIKLTIQEHLAAQLAKKRREIEDENDNPTDIADDEWD